MRHVITLPITPNVGGSFLTLFTPFVADCYAKAMGVFSKSFPNLYDPKNFMVKKVKRTLSIKNNDIKKAYDFLVGLDKELFNQYKKTI